MDRIQETTRNQNEYFTFKQVLSIAGIKPYVLRFWESEFDFIYPEVGEGSERVYTPDHLEKIIQLKKALFDQKMSILEAKSHFEKQEAPSVSSIDTYEEADFALEPELEKEVYQEAISRAKIDTSLIRLKLNKALGLIEKARI